MIVVGGLVTYYAIWARYFVQHRSGSALYAPLGWLRVRMAVFPVVVFLGASAWLGSAWTCVAAILLAAGTIPAL